MKILIASDIHGDADSCEKLLALYASTGAEWLLLLGDILYHGPRNPIPPHYDPQKVAKLLSAHKEHILCVRGNCDGEVDQMMVEFPILSETAMLFVDGRVWMAAHGHRAGANPTAQDLPSLPSGSVFLSGHTHIPRFEEKGGVACLNPGSVSIPKEGNPRSYAVYDCGEIKVQDLDGNIMFYGSVL